MNLETFFLDELAVAKGVGTFLSISDTTETNGGTTINRRRHEQVFPVFVIAVSLREVLFTVLGLVVRTTTNDSRASVTIFIDIGPLPDVTNKIVNTTSGATSRVSIDIGRRMIGIKSFATAVYFRNLALVPVVTPRIGTVLITGLCNELPFPFMWKTNNIDRQWFCIYLYLHLDINLPFASPLGVSTCIFNGDMDNRLVGAISGVTTSNPMLQEVGRVSRLIVGLVKELLKLSFGDIVRIDIEGLDLHAVSGMVASRLESIT